MFERLFDDWNKRIKDWLCEVLSILKYDESYGEFVMGRSQADFWYLDRSRLMCVKYFNGIWVIVVIGLGIHIFHDMAWMKV